MNTPHPTKKKKIYDKEINWMQVKLNQQYY